MRATARLGAAALSAAFTGLVAVVGLAVLAWAQAGPGLVERAARDIAAARGMPLETIDVRRATPRALVVRDLAVSGGGPAAARIEVAYDPLTLWRGRRVESLTVQGLTARLSISAAGVRVAGLPDDLAAPSSAGGGDGGTSLPMPPIDRVRLRDARVTIETSVGPVSVAAEADLAAPPGAAADLAAAMDLSTPWGAGRGSLEATAARDGAIDALVRLDADSLSGPLGTVDGLEAWVTVAGRPGAWREGAAEIRAARVVPAAGPAREAFHDVSVVARGAPLPELVLLRGAYGVGTRFAGDLSLGGEDFPETIAFDFDIESQAIEEAVEVALSSSPVSGRARVSGRLATDVAPWWPVPDLSAGLPAGAAVSGSLHAHLADAMIQGRLVDAEVSLATDLAVEGDRLRLTGREPWTVRGRLPGETEPMALRLGAEDERARLEVSGLLGEGPRGLSLAAPVGLSAGGGSLAGRTDIVATSAPDAPPRLDRASLDLAGGPIRWREAAVTLEALSLEGEGSAAGGRATVVATVAGDGPVGGVRIEGGRLDGRTTARWDAGAIRLAIGDCLRVAADAISAPAESIAGEWGAGEGVSLCLAAGGDGPAVTLQRGPGGGIDARGPVGLDLRLTGEPARLRTPGVGAVALTPPTLTVAGDLDPSGASGSLTLTATDGAARLPDIGLDLAGVGAEAVYAPAAERPVDLDLAIGQARLLREPAPLVPVSVRAAGGLDAGGRLALTGQAVGAAGGLTADLALQHDTTSGRGGVTVSIPSLAFAPEVRQPADVFPVLADAPLTAVTGALSGEAAFRWGAGTSSRATLSLEDIAVETPFAVAEGLSGTLTADSLLPPRLPPGQEIAVEAVDMGLLLELGRMRFGYGADRLLSVEALGFDWAGGRLEAEPFAARLDDRSLALVLTATEVDVATLLVAVPLENFEATGRLQGRMPVRLTPDTIIIDNAVLETTGPGVIRYRPEGAAEGVASADRSGGLSLLLQALEDFRYETLKLTLDGRTGEDLSATVSVLGANPELYDGWPVALDVNVGGELDRILRSGLQSLSLGRRTEDLLRGRIERAIEGGALDAPAPAGE
ncbi:MAG: YdbH domain-containing protein [Azospirillaceae bacterium]